MTKLDYHDAHAPYLAAVAAALQARGVKVADWGAGPNDPRDGYIEPAASTEPSSEETPDGLWFGWNEERGWYYGETSGEDPSQLAYTSYLGNDVLPAPDEIADPLARVAGGESLPDESPTPGYWSYRSYEDDGFETQLAAYAPAGTAVAAS